MQLKNNKIANWWLGLLLYTYFILLWGTFVRASRSGAGCGESWPACEGSLFVDMDNIAQLIEYFHRLTSGLYGVFALMLVVYTIKKRGFAKYGALCLGFLFFVFLEAWIGRMLVVNAYVVDDQRVARLVWMGFHFLNTLTLTASLILLWHRSKYVAIKSQNAVQALARYIFTSSLVVGFLLTSALGIVTAFYDTTVIKGDQSASGISPLLGFLRNVHPFVAMFYVLMVVYFFQTSEKSSTYRKLLLVILIANIVLGGLNIFFHHVTLLQVMHVLIAHLIWFLLLLIGMRKNA